MNSLIRMTAAGALYYVPSSDLQLLPAVMTDGSGNLIGSVDQGNGTAAVLATQIGGPVVTVYSEAATARTASGYVDSLKSGPQVSGIQEAFLGVNVTAVTGTSPTLTVSLEAQDANGQWQTVASTPQITQAGTVALSAGTGTQNPTMLNGGPYRLAWTLSAGASFTFQMSLQGR